MVSVSASVNLSLHHKVQKFCSGIGSPGWSRKTGRKTVVVCVCVCGNYFLGIKGVFSFNVGIVYGPVLRATVTDASEPPIEFAVYLEGT